MNIIRFVIKNRLLFNLLTVVVIVVGVYTAHNMRRDLFPNVSLNRVIITTAYFGASAHDIEKLITIPIEEELVEVDDIKRMMSVSAEGVSVITIEIDPDVPNTDKVVNNIQRAVDRVQDLPVELKDPPDVQELDTGDEPVIYLGFTGDATERELQIHAEILADRLLEISDVAKVNKSGWRDQEIWVEADPKKLDKYHLSLRDIITALSKRNHNLPGGTIRQGDEEFLVRTIGEFSTPDEIKKVIIRANDQGNWVLVEDVADVISTFEDETVIYRANGKRSINLEVLKKETGDLIKVVANVRDAVEEYRLELPENIEIKVYNDFSYFVKRRLEILKNCGLTGIGLVLLCLIVFLSPAVAFATALGIPVALFGTLLFMHGTGLTINLMSMFGLILVLGIVVDDAIVVSENSYRLIEEGMDPEEATILGASSMFKPVLTTVLTTILAFVPLLFMKGLFGKYTREIPLVVILALIFSFIEVFLVLPSHVVDFANMSHRRKKSITDKAQWRQFFSRMCDIPFVWIKSLGCIFGDLYQKLLQVVLRIRYLFVILMLTLFVFTIWYAYKELPKTLFPEGVIEVFYVQAEGPIGSSLEQVEKELEKIENILFELPPSELDYTVSSIGISGLSGWVQTRGSHLAELFVYLTPDEKRERSAMEIMDSLRDRIGVSPFFGELRFKEVEAGPPQGKPVEVKIRGEEHDDLLPIVDAYKDFLATLPGVIDITDDYIEGKFEYQITVKEAEAQKTRISVSDIAMAVRDMVDGGVATQIKTNDDEIDVVVRFPESHRKENVNFNDLTIPNRLGNLIPFYRVAEVRKKRGVSSINHYDRDRVITVFADIKKDVTHTREVNRQLQRHFQDISQKHPGVIVTYAGEDEDMKESYDVLLYQSLPISLLLIFVVLAATFNSLVHPFVIMAAIPFGFIGAVYALDVHNQAISFLSLLGIVGLSGVVVNDSIILVDYINICKNKGMDLVASILQGGKTRLRPVVLTTVTTVLGLTPVAYGIGGLAIDPFLKPMALAMGWGLVFATVITLFFIPCVYFILNSAQGRKMVLTHIALLVIIVIHILRFVRPHLKVYLENNPLDGFWGAVIPTLIMQVFEKHFFLMLIFSLTMGFVIVLILKALDPQTHIASLLIYPGIFICCAALFLTVLLTMPINRNVFFPLSIIMIWLYPFAHAQLIAWFFRNHDT